MPESNHENHEAHKLYLALKKHNISAESGKLDLQGGHDVNKKICLAIAKSKIILEIDNDNNDNKQHSIDSEQVLKDLRKIYHSLDKDGFTLKIPVSLLRERFCEVLDLITAIIEKSREPDMDEEAFDEDAREFE